VDPKSARRCVTMPESTQPLDIKAQLAEMLAELQARCPTLSPAVIPHGYDANWGGALLALCGSDKERDELTSVVQRSRTACLRCALTGHELPAEERRFVGLWELSPMRATLRLRQCAFVSPAAAQLLDGAGLLERFAQPGADSAELSELSQQFCTINGRADLCTPPGRAVEWLQECCALAYSCQVVSSSFPAWHVVGPENEELLGSVPQLVGRMLAAATDRPGKRKKGRAEAAVPSDGAISPAASTSRSTKEKKKRGVPAAEGIPTPKRRQRKAAS